MPVARSHPPTAGRGRSPDRGSGKVRTRDFNDKHYIFREREVGDIAFIVESGTVEIIKNVGGKEVVLGAVSKGGMFGEMALIDDRPRMASARAAGPVTVIVVSRQMMDKKISRMDPFTRGLVGILSDHVRRLAENPSLNAT